MNGIKSFLMASSTLNLGGKMLEDLPARVISLNYNSDNKIKLFSKRIAFWQRWKLSYIMPTTLRALKAREDLGFLPNQEVATLIIKFNEWGSFARLCRHHTQYAGQAAAVPFANNWTRRDRLLSHYRSKISEPVDPHHLSLWRMGKNNIKTSLWWSCDSSWTWFWWLTLSNMSICTMTN